MLRSVRRPLSHAIRNTSVLIAVVFALYLVSGNAQETTTVTISGEVSGASGNHTIHVALWDQSGFLQEPVRELRFEAGRRTRYSFDVIKGRWAISAFEDRNGNGVLDMGLFGPKEPNGFWPPFRGQHRPRFDEVAVSVDHDVADANINIR